MTKHNNDESLGENTMRGVDITEPELPTEITSNADGLPLPDELWDAVYEYWQDKCRKEIRK